MAFLGSASSRINYRRLNEKDADFLIMLMNSPEWLKYIGDRNVRNTQQVKLYLEKISPFCQEPWSGPFLMLDKITNEALGTIGIYKRETLDTPDLGFAILAEHRRKGYAMEASQWILSRAQEYSIYKVGAIVSPANIPSITLLKRLHFLEQKTIEYGEEKETLFYFEREF